MAVDTSFFQSFLAQELRAEGEVLGMASALLRILDRRGIRLSDSDRECILTCTDLDTLVHWIDRAVTASSVNDIFTEE
ncbi:hypothetical protein [Streptomyces himalayensis]|uniref:Uncharacterized protein n=1 Tax=Streptomyces himalayensis subsp. himalayensis TaxID=2756131 RepID=A0A7W0DTW8_9ACTN|nr:hypothetical protein [Streptomyces himalayensis]MBA2950379.1 hypothetical protein [Streptomyces himalayensis subsp. himalayensis]